MTVFKYLEEVEKYLKLQDLKFEVKRSAVAPFAPSAYDLIKPKGIILIWLDSVPNYVDERPRFQDGNKPSKSRIYKHLRIVLSIGVRSISEIPDMDSILESLEEHLIDLTINEYAPLQPVTITKMIEGENKVKWRQMYFDTTIPLVAEIHTN